MTTQHLCISEKILLLCDLERLVVMKSLLSQNLPLYHTPRVENLFNVMEPYNGIQRHVVFANDSTELGLVTKMFFFANLLVAIDIETVIANNKPSGIMAIIMET